MRIARVNSLDATSEVIGGLEDSRKEFFEGVRNAYQESGSFSPTGPHSVDDLELLLDGWLSGAFDFSKQLKLPLRAFDTRVVNRTDYNLKSSFEEKLRTFLPSHFFGSKLVGVNVFQFDKFLGGESHNGLIGRLQDLDKAALQSWAVHGNATGYDSEFDKSILVDSTGGVEYASFTEGFEKGDQNVDGLCNLGREQFLGSIFPGIDLMPASEVRVEERKLLNGNTWYRLSLNLSLATLLPERDGDNGRAIQEFKNRYMDIELDPEVKRQPLILVDGDSRPVYSGIPD